MSEDEPRGSQVHEAEIGSGFGPITIGRSTPKEVLAAFGRDGKVMKLDGEIYRVSYHYDETGEYAPGRPQNRSRPSAIDFRHGVVEKLSFGVYQRDVRVLGLGMGSSKKELEAKLGAPSSPPDRSVEGVETWAYPERGVEFLVSLDDDEIISFDLAIVEGAPLPKRREGGPSPAEQDEDGAGNDADAPSRERPRAPVAPREHVSIPRGAYERPKLPVFRVLFALGLVCFLVPRTVDRNPAPTADDADPGVIVPGEKSHFRIPTEYESPHQHWRVVPPARRDEAPPPGAQVLAEIQGKWAPVPGAAIVFQESPWGATMKLPRLWEANDVYVEMDVRIPGIPELHGARGRLVLDLEIEYPEKDWGSFKDVKGKLSGTRDFRFPTAHQIHLYRQWTARRSLLGWCGIAVMILAVIGGIWRTARD